YAGELADALTAERAARGGLLTREDLEGFAPVVEEPLRGRYADVEVLTARPNSSGVLLLQALAAIEALGLEDPLGADAAQLATILRSGSAQREQRLADPRAVAFDPDEWLGAERIAALAEAAAAGRSVPAAGMAGARPDGDTVAIVAADGQGGAVSIIQSVFHSFGAQILEPATGVLLHNRGASFAMAPDHPNRLAPGRRPSHTLMPVMVERSGELRGVLGTMGGKVQPQIHTQVLHRLLEGATPQAAIDAPRWVVGALEAGEADGTVRVEDGVHRSARAALDGFGLHVVDVERGSEDLGHYQAIWRDGGLAAGSDFRADGAAITG
ncbi:MAG TPA: gamma-glutamyltransferase, partial [Baekduia sp.]|nr:gamma-glutamyltransferase [Baekduia sp.]